MPEWEFREYLNGLNAIRLDERPKNMDQFADYYWDKINAEESDSEPCTIALRLGLRVEWFANVIRNIHMCRE